MPRRIPASPPDKTPADTVPENLLVYRARDWLPDGLDVDTAGDQELREAYQRHTAARVAWYASHDLRPVSALLADPVAMADIPWSPADDPP